SQPVQPAYRAQPGPPPISRSIAVSMSRQTAAAHRESERFCIVDAEQGAAAVRRDIETAIERLIGG
ncbi:MAG: hypothetical protein P8Y74_13490, partial [Desulfobacterales bacterium]